jgi:DNA-binding beta-propeller fold protein YncE
MKNPTLCLTLSLALGLATTGCSGETCDPTVPGTICTIAGSGNNGYDRDADNRAIPAEEVRFSLPQDTLTGSDGTIYILDWNNHRLRSLGADGMVRWVAGRGELGGTLDDPASGDFNHPTDMVFDEDESHIILAAWHNSMIRTVDLATSMVTDSCGDGRRAYFGDEGPALSSALDLPASVAWDPDGNLVVMDQANQVLRMIDADGVVHLRAGRCVVDAAPPNGPGTCDPSELTQCPPDPAGNVSGKWVCGDPMEFCSRPCTPGYSGDEIPATELRMAQPFGQSATPAGRILFDPEGNLYFADTSNHMVRMIDTDGIVHRVAGQPPVDGVAQRGTEGDGGPALDAFLNHPVDLALGDDGTLYIADVNNHCVRAIDPSGIIDTVAGVCGMKGYAGDGGPAGEALLNLPFGVEFTPDGDLIVSDTGNSVLRRITLP